MNYNHSNLKLKKKVQSKRIKDFLYLQYYNSVVKNKQKRHSSYQKMYSIKSENSNSENENMQKKSKSKKSHIYSTEKVLQKTFQKKTIDTSSFHFPKITHPKLPFSKRSTLDPEEKKQKILKLKPSILFHDFYTIQWLRKKYGNSNIKKSIYSLLPNNGKPVIPDDESEKEKRHRLTMEFLENSKKTEENLKTFANINPKYLFDETTFEKILKLKEIFLEFDEDDSRKMEIDEMVKMFNDNHIYANIDELVQLFFKDKKYKKEEIMNLYLDFYQFMIFALTKDQDFRNFMRGIKKKSNDNKNKNQNKGYLPMSFNLVLDYFIAKGKERSSIEKIQNAINEIDKIIETNQMKQKDVIYRGNDFNIFAESSKNKKSPMISPPFQPGKKLQSNNNVNRRHSFFAFMPKQNLNDDCEKEIENYEEQFKKINFCELIEEFAKLFKGATNSANEFSKTKIKKTQSQSVDNKRSSELLPSSILLNDGGHIITDQGIENSNFYVNTLPHEISIKELLKKQIDKNKIKKMNYMNYDKFRSVQLALDTTKQQLNLFKRNKSLNRKIKTMSNSNKCINSIFINMYQNKNNSISNKNIKDINKDINKNKKEKTISLLLNKPKINNRNDSKKNINKTQFEEYSFRKNNINEKLKNKNLKTNVINNAGILNTMNNGCRNDNKSNLNIKNNRKQKNDYVPIELMK